MFKLKAKYLKEVTAAAKPLERASRSKYKNENKSLCRRRRAAWYLQLVDEGYLEKENYFGLPGDSFLMEKLLVKLGLFSKEEMHLIDRDNIYKIPNGFSVKKLNLLDLSNTLVNSSDEERDTLPQYSFADLDLCSSMSVRVSKFGNREHTKLMKRVSKITDMCAGIWVHSNFVTITVEAAREPYGIKGLEDYTNYIPLSELRVGGNSVRSLFEDRLDSKKKTKDNFLRMKALTTSMRVALDKAGGENLELIVLDADFYNGVSSTPMMAMAFTHE